MDREFNLLEDPWIRVLDGDLTLREVSLSDALVHAHEYRALSGELPTQDAAMLRLLLSCLQTCFYRWDAQGQPDPISGDEGWDKQDVLERWGEYHEAGRLPESCLRGYLQQHEERFWLFHPQTPFYQVAGLEHGTDYGAQGLLGNLKSSNNKATRHHFSMSEGAELLSLSYAAAARWLVYLQAYSVNVKNDRKAAGGQQAAGTGRLGKLGLIYVDAPSLFELLLRNLTPLRPNGGGIWGAPRPIWEEPVRVQQSTQIAPPDNLPQRYTLQSRRILLLRSDDAAGRVYGVRVMNGDFFGFEDDFGEPMTLWKQAGGGTKKKEVPAVYIPRQHRPEVQLWREFASIFYVGGREGAQAHIPGVVEWIGLLCSRLIPRGELITLRTAGLQYGDAMSYTYGDCLSDGLSLSSGLLTELGQQWLTVIRDEIDKCAQVTDRAMKQFARSVTAVLDPGGQDTLSPRLTEEFYARIDAPFRRWLADIRPGEDSREQKAAQWEQIARQAALQIVKRHLDDFGVRLFMFRETERGLSSIPRAFNQYRKAIFGIYKQTAAGRDQRQGQNQEQAS